ncbi:dolichyl-phosphate-mannose--protein mannosyltransferase [Raineyella fluvialis]|uniref:Polyprenol-phosphate-mannose--protein mannosyltransferase n=1 Tax=Raineyella fluvialis TaxID=2662261 RepID=A0A5Q2FJ13_9ACTN|nr:phospholipid carrier-dependent glycosyltransferase [Raineyella fluvialis]QGF25183.1 phospholipid carrier-dependent glycosyltransferase [Raineyella fluvialis]
MPSVRQGWLIVAVVSVVAFLLRLWHLGDPVRLVFDETYYAKDAWSVLHHGYELTWSDNANDLIVRGAVDQMGTAAEFVVHPPMGKLLIAVGEWMFGMTPSGWRFMAVVFGTLLISATMVLTRRLSRSNLVAAIAGILLTVDGLAFTMSRLALLDIFQATFLVAAVACLVRDRDAMRARLATHLETRGLADLDGSLGPLLWWRPWRAASGVLFGCSIATKWDSVYALAAFAILSLAWDIGARRLAGARNPLLRGALRDGIPAFLQLVPVALAAYLTTWIPWLATASGWDRQWAAEHPETALARHLPRALASLVAFHREIYQFHTGSYINHATHPYQSGPWGWLILMRPLGLDAVNDIAPGTDGCPPGTENCIRVMTTLGTPLLWWGAAAALVAAILLWIGLRDQRFSVPVVGALAMWLPWYQYTDRPLFYFYAICIVPFTVTALAMCLGRIIGPVQGGWRRRLGAIVAGLYVALVILNFAYFWPIYTDGILTWSQWWARMWFTSWV